MPWPLSNRDYLYARRGVKIDETFLLISRDVPHHPDAPEQKGVVRCEPCRQHMALREVDGKHTEFALQYADDLKVSAAPRRPVERISPLVCGADIDVSGRVSGVQVPL